MSELNKTDFIQYLNCPTSLWLMLNKPLEYPYGEFTAFQKKLTAEGYEVEAHVQSHVGSFADNSQYEFQRVFENDELYAKADMVRTNYDGTIDLYEIKSSTSVKDGNPHNQLKDAAFQAIVANQCGHKIGKIFIMHLNKEYRRDGEIDPAELLVFADETVRVKTLLDETKQEIDAALRLLDTDAIDESSCSCLIKGRDKHCESFDYFNSTIPKPSIYNLPRISTGKNFRNFVSEGRFDLDSIDASEVSKLQRLVLEAYKNGSPLIDEEVIEGLLGKLVFPLYFLDYEGYGSAIPICDGASPQVQFPFQYSLHVLHEDDRLEHHEYLAEQAQMPLELIQQLEQDIGETGSIVSWHKQYENLRNKEMAQLYPEKAEFLNDLIERTVDLEDVFKTGYVDIAFGGSTSIKKVLPVIVPDLSYSEMDISDGTAAMDGWKKMLAMTGDAELAAQRKALLEYCELDTFAMVRIYKFLTELGQI